VQKLLDIVWHNAVESLVEHRAWLAEDRRGRSRLGIRADKMTQDVNSAFSPDQSVFCSTAARGCGAADASPAYAALPSLVRHTNRPAGNQRKYTKRLTNHSPQIKWGICGQQTSPIMRQRGGSYDVMTHWSPPQPDSVGPTVVTRHLCIHRVKWRHRVYGHDTIAILWV